ncbi:MAG: PEP-CTERM sorting domain-containing protein [Planctomycetia bacterium]|nr:PEP-CTERM sorting domain-containing protein [Planctomycetia bacterium]
MNTGDGIVYVADQDSTVTKMNLSGTGKLVVNEIRFGQHGDATMNMSGNSVMEAKTFCMGYSYDDTHSVNTSITLKENATLKAEKFYMAYGQGSKTNAVNATLTLLGDSKMEVSGDFIPFRGFHANGHTGKACATLVMDDNASLTTGNFWGGSNNANNYAAPADGNEYAAYYTFSGNSKLSVAEWWVAMSAKSYVLIEENAEITSRNGNSGLAWSAGANGSLLEMTGGKLTVPNFYISNGSNHAATMNQSGGLVNFGTLKMTSPNADLNISDDAVMKVDTTADNGGEIAVSGGDLQIKTLNNNAGGRIQVSGGDLYATTINNVGTMKVTDAGRVQVGTIGATTGETLTISGANAISMNGDFVLDIFSLTDFDKLNVAEGSTLDFGTEAGLVLSIAKEAGFSNTEGYVIDNWITSFDDLNVLQSLNLSVEGANDFVAFMNANGGIVFGNANAVPEPASIILLLLGVFGLVAVRKSTRK